MTKYLQALITAAILLFVLQIYAAYACWPKTLEYGKMSIVAWSLGYCK